MSSTLVFFSPCMEPEVRRGQPLCLADRCARAGPPALPSAPRGPSPMGAAGELAVRAIGAAATPPASEKGPPAGQEALASGRAATSNQEALASRLDAHVRRRKKGDESLGSRVEGQQYEANKFGSPVEACWSCVFLPPLPKLRIGGHLGSAAEVALKVQAATTYMCLVAVFI
jgi:hypothetical protein